MRASAPLGRRPVRNPHRRPQARCALRRSTAEGRTQFPRSQTILTSARVALRAGTETTDRVEASSPPPCSHLTPPPCLLDSSQYADGASGDALCGPTSWGALDPIPAAACPWVGAGHAPASAICRSSPATWRSTSATMREKLCLATVPGAGMLSYGFQRATNSCDQVDFAHRGRIVRGHHLVWCPAQAGAWTPPQNRCERCGVRGSATFARPPSGSGCLPNTAPLPAPRLLRATMGGHCGQRCEPRNLFRPSRKVVWRGGCGPRCRRCREPKSGRRFVP